MQDVFHDLKCSVRQWRRVPVLVAGVLGTLALAIGASTLLVAIANATFFRSLPYPNASRLVAPSVQQKDRDIGRMDEPTSRLAERGLAAFESFALYNPDAATLVRGDYPERITGARVSETFFQTLGVGPALGRTFNRDELRPGGPRVIILSDAVWTRRFGRQTDIVGQRVAVDDGAYEVIGVMPRGFGFPGTSELWTPLIPRQLTGGLFYIDAIARLQPSTSAEQARAALLALRQSNATALPAAALQTDIRVVSLHERLYGSFTRPIILLLGTVACVLLIGCANIANLLLARSSSRQSELAIRAAIGAGRGRLFRQLLTENLVLAGLGAACGVGLAFVGLEAFRAYGPPALARLPALAIDGRVLLVTLAVTIGTGLLFGVAPALSAVRVDPGERLKGTSARHTSGARPRRALVVLQIAPALVLSIGAALLGRSFIRYQAVERGFDTGNVLTANITLPTARYPDVSARRGFFDSLTERLQGMPHVDSVVVSNVALSGLSMTMRWQPGSVDRERAPEIGVVTGIDRRHFHTFGIPVLEGRECADRSDGNAAVVNESMARTVLRDQPAAGRTLDLAHVSLGVRTVIGIVADVRDLRTKAAPLPMIYACAGSERAGYGVVAVRARQGTPAMSLAPQVRSVVRALDPLLPVTRVTTVEQMVRDGLSSRWFDAMVIAALAGLALVLALGGLYAVTAYSVAQRTREIGLRMALGADRATVMRMVLRDGSTMVGVGTLVGGLAALPLVKFVSTLLFDVQPLDPVVFATVVVVVATVAMLATFVPAWRASRVSPMETLRAN